MHETHAKGTLQWSVSQGIVSAVERLIQVDAPLNPGISGGPMSIHPVRLWVWLLETCGDNLFLGPYTFVPSMIDEPSQQRWWNGQLSLGVSRQIPLNAQGLPIWTGHVETLPVIDGCLGFKRFCSLG